jgi:hypothetical protein
VARGRRLPALCRLLTVCLPLIATARAPAQSLAPPAASRPTVAAAPAAAPIVIDGRLDEADWQGAEVATGFLQRDPDEGQPASERTEVRILFDEAAIYVGARMFDRDPAAIARHLTRRDDDGEEVADAFHVAFDALHDRLTGTHFGVTAAGTQVDEFLFDDTNSDESWDAVWDSAVLVDDEGWTAELRIPLSQLRFSPGRDQTWGLHLVRYIKRRAEESWWALVGKKESGIVSRMGQLTGLDAQGRRHLALLPYATLRGEFLGEVDDEDPFRTGAEATGGLGLDVKWGVTNRLTLDATVNPDFGQVEVDPAVVNLTAFETFFEERRPFFVEGSNILQNFGRNGATNYFGFNRSNPTLFYSRRIGRQPQGRAAGEYVDVPSATTILSAAKLTGKTPRGWSLNFIDAVTAREYADVALGPARRRTEVEPLTNYLATRVRRDVGQRAGFGMIATAVHRDLSDPSLADQLAGQAYMAGVDGHLFLDQGRDWVVTSGLSGSYVSGTPAAMLRLQRSSARYYQRPDAPHIAVDPAAESMQGWNLQVDVNKNSGRFLPNASAWAVSPGYEVNDLGFQTSADRRGTHAAFLWRNPTPDAFSRYRQFFVAKWYAWNGANDRLGDGLYASTFAQFRNYWTAGGGLHVGRDVYSDRLTRGGPLMRSPGFRNVFAEIETDERKAVSFSLEGSCAWTTAGGWEASGEFDVEWKPTTALSIRVGPEWRRELDTAQYVRTVADPAATSTFGARYVFGELTQTEVSMVTRVNLILSPRMSLQVYAQPLLSAGRYAFIKEAAAPRTYDFLRYGLDAGSIAYDEASDRYLVDPTSDGSGRPFVLDNPDFNITSLRVNAVFRWEFRPGSTAYVVWTQQREDEEGPGRLAFGPELTRMFSAPSDNVVMVKVSYWFSR